MSKTARNFFLVFVLLCSVLTFFGVKPKIAKAATIPILKPNAGLNNYQLSMPANIQGFRYVFGDLDGDGKDEVIVGGTVLNGDGTKRWSLKDRGYGYMDLVQPGDHRPGNGMAEIYYLAVETTRGSFDGGSNPIVVDQNGSTVWENWSVYYCDHNARGWAGDVTGDGLAEFYADDHTYDVCPDDGSIPKASYDNQGNVFDRI